MAEEPQPHLLVVDDHREIREALQDYLQHHGYRVTVAASAARAREVIRDFAVDLVVLDIMMPGEDGITLCRDLRAQHRMPIIFLTAMTDETDRIVGLELGADDYLAKPFNPRELLARVRAVMRRWHELPPQRLAEPTRSVRFERWTLDPQRRELIGDDDERVALSSGEFSLLTAFLNHPGQVLTRDQLLDLTRGREARVYDRSIDIQVSRLRRKIEADPARPRIITTQWGGGYRLTVAVETLG